MILSSILVENARVHARRTAILGPDGILTWNEFSGRVARAAGLLRRLGLRRGDRYALLMRNNFRQAELMWAGYWSGIVPVPVNWRLSPAEIGAILEDSESKLVAAEAEFLPILQAPSLGPWRDRILTVEAQGGTTADYEAKLTESAPLDPEPVSENDDAILLYTGGTTGKSKGVRLSHRNILSNAWQIGLAIRLKTEDVYSHVAPMFHAADLHGTVAFLLGCAHVYVPQFTPAMMAQQIERHRITIAHWVPTMVKMFADSVEAQRHDLSSLRLLYYGSSPIPVEWIRAIRAVFPGVELYHSYGITETSPILTVLHHSCVDQAFESGDLSLLRSAGKPVAGLQMRILDDAGQPLGAGEAGEVVVRGPNVSPGYLKRETETAQAFRDGWYHTGDIGRIDGNGFLFLVDRKKDMIVTGGENVYSNEVESALFRHPGVAEAAVIGVPDELLGEALFAVIAPKPGTTLSAEEIIRHCREHIGGYKIPRRMAFVQALPRTALGKVQKSVLRGMYAHPDPANSTVRQPE